MKSRKLSAYELLNITYCNFWLDKCPTNGNVKAYEINGNYLEITEKDKNIYKDSGKIWYDEITGFAISNGYIQQIRNVHGDSYFELTEKGVLAKYIGGHEKYVDYIKMKSNSYKSQRTLLGFTAFISLLTLCGTVYSIWKQKPIIVNVSPSPVLIQQVQAKKAVNDSVTASPQKTPH